MNHLWWVLQIVGCAAVVAAQTVNRTWGFGIPSWIVYSLISVFVTYPAFGKSYTIAPTFFGAFFVGQTALNVLGGIASLLLFKDVITMSQWIGMALSVVGGYLLIK